jgi:small subunit ribosomal protein S16
MAGGGAGGGGYEVVVRVWQNGSVTPWVRGALSRSLTRGTAGLRHWPPPVWPPSEPSFMGEQTVVAVKIKLKRMGKIRAPYYRIIVADARTKRDGRAIEEIGKYHPKEEPSLIEVNSERAQHWLSVGAQPTDPVRKLFEITGDWQKFKGLPGAEGTLKTAAPKTDKREAFAAAVAETLKEGSGDSKGKARRPAAKADASAKADAGAEGKAEPARQAKGGRSGKAVGGAKAEAGEDAAAEAPAEQESGA